VSLFFDAQRLLAGGSLGTGEPHAHAIFLKRRPEAEEEHAIIPEYFPFPNAPGKLWHPITCTDGMPANHQFPALRGNVPPEPLNWSRKPVFVKAIHRRNARVYTFTLRAGVTFSDGSVLTAADVKATLDRARTSERYRQRLLPASPPSLLPKHSHHYAAQSQYGPACLAGYPIVKSGTHQNTAAHRYRSLSFFEADGAAYLVANQSWWRGGGQRLTGSC
jgi:peptide/nickel transport system substrate-binding protein